MASTPELLCVSFYIYEPSLPQFMERPLHAGPGTVAQRRHGPYVHRAGIPAATAEFQAAVDRELNRSQAVVEQDRVHLKWLLA